MRGGCETFRTAYELGVPIYAGTDAGGSLPHGLIGAELERMVEFAPVEYVLGAGSWRAREWLGRPVDAGRGRRGRSGRLRRGPASRSRRAAVDPRLVVLRGATRGPAVTRARRAAGLGAALASSILMLLAVPVLPAAADTGRGRDGGDGRHRRGA